MDGSAWVVCLRHGSHGRGRPRSGSRLPNTPRLMTHIG